jgi:hypothetical protein
MARFADLEAEEPDVAAGVRAAFDMQFVAGEPWLAGMTRSAKFADLRRDPRFALHSGSDEPDSWNGDAKLSGSATELTGDDERRDYATAAGVTLESVDYELFRVDLDQVVLVHLNEERSALVIASWRPGRGVTRTIRD